MTPPLHPLALDQPRPDAGVDLRVLWGELEGEVMKTEPQPVPLSEGWLSNLLFALACLSDDDLVRLAAVARRVVDEAEEPRQP